MPIYRFRCEDGCCQDFSLMMSIGEYEEVRDMIWCALCGSGVVSRHFDPPAMMEVAMVDGRGHAMHNQEYIRVREAAKLEVTAASMRPDKRGEINKEINKLRAIKPE